MTLEYFAVNWFTLFASLFKKSSWTQISNFQKFQFFYKWKYIVFNGIKKMFILESMVLNFTSLLQEIILISIF